MPSLVCQQHATARAARAEFAVEDYTHYCRLRLVADAPLPPLQRNFAYNACPCTLPPSSELVSRGSVRLNGHDVLERARYVGSEAEAI